MEEKNNLYIIAIVAIIAIVGVIVLITSGNKMESATVTEDTAGQAVAVTKPINAHSCNADGTCEINAGQMKSAKLGQVNSQGLYSFIVTSNSIVMTQPVNIMTTEFAVDAITYILSLSDSTGSTNGYVCTDYIGKLYRSSTPCVETNGTGTIIGQISCRRAEVSYEDTLICDGTEALINHFGVCAEGGIPVVYGYASFDNKLPYGVTYHCLTGFNNSMTTPSSIEGFCCK
jgi:hypothetical protein